MLLFRERIRAMLTILFLYASQISATTQCISNKDQQCSADHIENEFPEIRNSQVRYHQEQNTDGKDN